MQELINYKPSKELLDYMGSKGRHFAPGIYFVYSAEIYKVTRVVDNNKPEQEYANEAEFVKLIAGQNAKVHNDWAVREMIVWECIAWWKFKNQFKRAITKDDALAYRMITQRMTSPNYHKFEKY